MFCRSKVPNRICTPAFTEGPWSSPWLTWSESWVSVGPTGTEGASVALDIYAVYSDTLISPSGKILIPGIREAVAPLSDEEWKMYQDIQFDMDNYKDKVGVSQLMYNNKVRRGLDKIWEESGRRRGTDGKTSCRWTCWPTCGGTPPSPSTASRGLSPTPGQRQSSPLRSPRSSPSDRSPTWTLPPLKNRYSRKSAPGASFF